MMTAAADLSREPFADGIDPRVLGRALDPTTGEVTGPRSERRMFGADGNASTGWPPRSSGPLPPRDGLPPDLNIGTAQDEVDAWAWEHDYVTRELADVRARLSGDPHDPHADSVEGRLILARAAARRAARRNPLEKGRRTSGDIDSEVDEQLELDGIAGEHRRLVAYQDTLTSRLFKAKDNVSRLQAYIATLPRLPDHRP